MPFPGERGPSLGERFVSAALWLLVAVIALTMAVELLRGIWPWLFGLGFAVFIVIAVVGWLRTRARGW